MKTYTEYKPQLQEVSAFINIPNPLKNWLGYIFIIVLVVILVCCVAIGRTEKHIAKIENKYIEITEYFEATAADNAALEAKIQANMEALGYNEKQIKSILREVELYTKKHEDIKPFTLADADEQFRIVQEDYAAAQDTLNQLTIFEGMTILQIPDTEDGKAYKQALQVLPLPVRRSDALKLYLGQTVQPLQDVLQLNQMLTAVNNKLEEQLQAKIDKELEQQRKEQEKLEQQQSQQQTQSGTLPPAQQQTPQTQQQQQAPQQTTKPKPNNSDIPVW